MADKKITDLQLIASIDGSENLPVDDGIQTYRVTAQQIKDWILASENVVRDMIEEAERIPRGSIQAYGGTTAPSGWLLCDGSTVSRTTYEDLYAVIGDAFGNGDGSTTFHLPDLRGRFVRGVDDGQGRDPDRASRTALNSGGNTGDNVGSYQTDDFEQHNHQVVSDSGLYAFGGSSSGSGFGGTGFRSQLSTKDTGNAGGSTETRPKNVYVNYIIKT